MSRPFVPRLRRRLSDDDGFTLVEQLVTVVLLGIGVVAVLGAILTLLSTSTRHRDLSNATAVLANAAELVTSPDTPWVSCSAVPGPAATYQSAAQVPPGDLPEGVGVASVAITVTDVQTWDGRTFSSGCVTAPGFRAQLVTIRVVTGVADEQVQVVKWNGTV